MARAHGKPVAVIAGSIDPGYDARAVFDAAESASPPGMPLEEAMRDAASLVRDAAARAVRVLMSRTQ
jgi:glycerate kinase